MISKENIRQIVEKALEGTTSFLVEIVVKPGNAIEVFIDDDQAISIDFCVQISRIIEENLDREIEDFSIEVSSAGIGNPFKVRRQYQKAIGKEIEITLADGKKLTGTLQSIDQEGVFFKTTKPKTKKKISGDTLDPKTDNPQHIRWESIRQAKEILKFK